MGLFSKAVDYNSLLEQVLEKKRFSSNIKSLLSSLLYRLEASYSDYSIVKNVSKTKEQFLVEIIKNIKNYFEVIKTVEPDSEEAKALLKYNTLALTNEKERTVLTYPTEAALLYAISDIEPKFFHIENFIFKKEFQEILVEGSNIETLEILENFTGWSWNPKSELNINHLANLIYQNLLMILGQEKMDIFKRNNQKELDLISEIKNYSEEYYDCLVDLIFICNKENKVFINKVNKKYEELSKALKSQENIEKLQRQKELSEKKLKKLDMILKDELLLKKSFKIKLEKSKEKIKFSDYKISLLENRKKLLKIINETKKYTDPENLEVLKKQYEEYKRVISLDKSLEDAICDLEISFIKILYKNFKEVKTRENFIDIIYKVRYFRNIYVTKEKCIKDFTEIENKLKEFMGKLITFGTKNAFLKMFSFNIGLNSKIIYNCLDSKSIKLEELRIKLNVMSDVMVVQVIEKETFEKSFQINLKKIKSPELTIKKNKLVKLFI